MNFEELLSDARDEQAIRDEAAAKTEVRPEEGYRATTLFDSFPGLMPFA
ncbi:MAG: hypothetical protein K1X57_20870 [Gemmataceae bacterium]|nr:hypothetical protein [Gemmataceae bacterium]